MKQKQIKWYFLFFAVLLVFIWIMHFNGLYGQDSYEYLRYTKCIKEFIETGKNPGDYFWPMLYPIMGACFSFIFPLPFALQFLSILSLALAGIFLQKLLCLLFQVEKDVIYPYLFLFFLLSPYILRSSLVVMSDSLAVFCITASVYCFEQYKRILSPGYFLALVFFSAMAVLTRYAAFVILLPFVVAVLVVFFKNFKTSLLFAALGIVFLLLLPHIIIKKHDLLGFIHHEWVGTWSAVNLFHRDFHTSNGYASYTFDNGIYTFFNVIHPAYCFAGIVFLFFLPYRKLKSTGALIYILSFLMYALFIAGIPFQNMRFLLLSFPLVLVILFPGYRAIRQLLENKKVWKYTVWAIVIIQILLFARVFLPFYKDNKVEKAIAEKMLPYPDKTVYTFSIDGALKSYGFTGKIVNMYLIKLDTVQKIDTAGLVLFNPGQFSEIWKDKNPMLNWNFFNAQYRLVKLEDMPDGWSLYRVLCK